MDQKIHLQQWLAEGLPEDKFHMYDANKDGTVTMAKFNEYRLEVESGALGEDDKVQEKADIVRYNYVYLTVSQSLNFLSCYALARIIAAKRFYQDSDLQTGGWM